MFEVIISILVVMLLVLATMDLFVGVSNDAANFLNSAVGTRIAPLYVIMIVASIGILLGATFSSGMMEVARKGMFFPEQFNFEEIMLIFAAVMISDVLLLNLFNSFGLPTSTTVSIIFELLGSATFASVFKIYHDGQSFTEVFNYIKLDKTATIVSAILLSVVIAFIAGALVQFISRVLFSFKFNISVKFLGGIYAGASLSAIFYFLVMKGAKGASFMTPEYLDFLNNNFTTIMWSVFVVFSVLGQIIVLFNGNVFRLIILAGTFALAFSFAGNDLVNFVGVPLAALDSFNHWLAFGNGDKTYVMSYLNESSVTGTIWLFLAGSVMCITLWVSKKAKQVIQTSINLSASDSGNREQFGASTLGRVITRTGLAVSRTVYHLVPLRSLAFIKTRYKQPPVVKGEVKLPFDYVRGSINLVVSATLISFATSLKLPLSTTYVCFMVAMGSSFADGAWDRESAVYRISGVITVVAGWFLTGICAFTFSFFINFILFNVGFYGALAAIPMVYGIIIYTNFIRKTKQDTASAVLNAKSDKEILNSVATSIPVYFQKELSCLKKSLEEFFDDNELALRKLRNKASNINEAISNERSVYYSLATNNNNNLLNNQKENTSSNDAKFFFYLVFSNLREVSKSVHYTIDQALQHVANRHTIFGGTMKESLFELFRRINKIGDDLNYIEYAPNAQNVETLVKHSKKLNRDIDRCQFELVSIIGREHVSMHSSEMYLTFLQCMRDIANRYVAVSMQERALAEIVLGKVIDNVDSQVQSSVLPTVFREDREDLVMDNSQQDTETKQEDNQFGIVNDDDNTIYELPKSPAELESIKADEIKN